MKALCIIDVQEDFEDTCADWLLKNIQKLIFKAKKDKRIILNVKLKHSGPILLPIWNNIHSYKKRIDVIKTTESGHNEIKKLDIFPSLTEIIVCGVYTGACVFETAANLLKLGKKIHVPLWAVNHSLDWEKWYNVNKFRPYRPEHIQIPRLIQMGAIYHPTMPTVLEVQF